MSMADRKPDAVIVGAGMVARVNWTGSKTFALSLPSGSTRETLQSVLVDFCPIFATFVSAPTIEVGGDCPLLAFGCTIGANCSPSAVGTRRRAG